MVDNMNFWSKNLLWRPYFHRIVASFGLSCTDLIVSHFSDASGAKDSGSGRDNGTKQVPEKGAAHSLPTSQETKDKECTPASR